MKVTRHLLLLLALLAMAVFEPSPTALGGTVLSNLSNTVENTVVVNDTDWIANSFKTDNQSWLLNSVTVLMDDPLVLGPGSPGVFSVSVWSDNNFVAPKTLLQTLVGPSNPSSAGTYTYSASGSGLALEPLTNYWLVTSTADTGLYWYLWCFTLDNATTGGWTIPVTKTRNLSADEGVTWTGAADAEPQMFSINATLVPEPSTYAMALAGLACGGFSMWRRRKRA